MKSDSSLAWVSSDSSAAASASRACPGKPLRGRRCATARQTLRDTSDGEIKQREVDAITVIEALIRRVQPLPQLRTTDFGGGRVFHQVVDGHTALPVQPSGQIAHADIDVSKESRLGNGANAGVNQQIAADLHVLAFALQLVWRGHVLIEDLFRHRDQSRMGDPGSIVSSGHFTQFVRTDAR